MSLATLAQELYEKFGRIKGITIEIQGELIAIGVRNQAASATIFLQGAQLTHYKNKDHKEPIIWLSDACTYKEGSPLRGGIPVCWPWFGDLAKNPQAIQQQLNECNNTPAHGFVRQMQWQLNTVETLDENTTKVGMSLTIDKNTHPSWPFSCQLSMEFTIGTTLTVSLSVHNSDETAFSYSTALHSYFKVKDIHATTVSGLLNCQYLDCLNNWEEKTQGVDLAIGEEVDRLYYHDNDEMGKTIAITDNARSICLNSLYSKSCIVWNPWIEKSQRLSQFNDDDYKRMICVETANAGQDAITLAAGETQLLILELNQTPPQLH